MSKEAMKLALEALEVATTPFARDRQEVLRAKAALREALAKPDFWEGYVPEPDKRQQALDKMAENAKELGLDYEPAQQYSATSDHRLMENAQGELERIKLVQTGVGIGKPEQEPVAWRWSESGGVRWFDWTTDWSHYDRAKAMGFPIQYAAPQPAQRTWVGLTDEEIWKFWWSRPEVPEGEDDSMEAEFVAAVRRVLAAHGIKENT